MLLDNGRLSLQCLQAVAPYKNRLPKSEDEIEYIENLFNALCSTLMTERNRQGIPCGPCVPSACHQYPSHCYRLVPACDGVTIWAMSVKRDEYSLCLP